MQTYSYHQNVVRLLTWLEENPPKDIHHLSPINREEVCEPGKGKLLEIAKPDVSDYHSQYQGQFSPGNWLC